jgi:hypothetical protein
MTEQEIIEKLALADKEVQDAKKALADARRRWTDAETNLISAKLHWERTKEELRVHRNTVPRSDPSRRDQEVEQFRKDNPEIVQWARERDKLDDEE